MSEQTHPSKTLERGKKNKKRQKGSLFGRPRTLLLYSARQVAMKPPSWIPSSSLTKVWSAQTWTLRGLFTHIIVRCKEPFLRKGRKEKRLRYPKLPESWKSVATGLMKPLIQICFVSNCGLYAWRRSEERYNSIYSYIQWFRAAFQPVVFGDLDARSFKCPSRSVDNC